MAEEEANFLVFKIEKESNLIRIFLFFPIALRSNTTSSVANLLDNIIGIIK
jgi:hypothetical protein